jgi:hypothetical protein
MYKNPLVVGVQQAGEDSAQKTVKELLWDLGRNTGNMMFTEAIVRTVKQAKLTSFGFSEPDLEGRDCIIIAAANWINSYDDLGWLADKLERSTLPIVVIGIGAQSDSSATIPAVSPGTLRFLRLAADRSAAISTRGNYSSEVLGSYGIKNSRPTGCPSLLLAGLSGPNFRAGRSVDPSAACLHSTRHFFNIASDRLQRFIYEQAFKQKIDILLQSELADFYFALGRLGNTDILKQASETVTKNYGCDDVDTVSSYLKKHGKVFFKYDTWIKYMSSCSFTLGTRIHGTISSLISGTPAVLVAHDTRTTEMAEIMSIPFVKASSIATDRDLDVAGMYDREWQGDFASGYRTYYGNFMNFFAENSIPI